jgi:YebC/PmpR family DNA-binding regulatory protein
MSGHSKWHKIKHKKGANDAKRGSLFTKLGKAITLAASEGGGDPDMNFALRLAMDKAKAANMPSDNIDRAIKKGTGEAGGEHIERISYEAYGPAGSAMIIDCTTDNKNRTISEARNIVEGSGGKFAEAGSVSWQFEEKGIIVIKPAKLKKAEKYGAEDTYEPAQKDEIMMEAMEIDGVEDITEESMENEEGVQEDIMEITTSKIDFAKADKAIRDSGIEVISSELVKIAKDKISLETSEKARVERLVESLEEHDDIDNVWTNVSEL